MKNTQLGPKSEHTAFIRKTVTGPLRREAAHCATQRLDRVESWMGRDQLAGIVESVVEHMGDFSSLGLTLLDRRLVRRHQVLISILCYSYSAGIYATSEIHQRLLADIASRNICHEFEITSYCLRHFRARHSTLLEHAIALTLSAVFRLRTNGEGRAPHFSTETSACEELLAEARCRIAKASARDATRHKD